jgi:hypothetical protein
MCVKAYPVIFPKQSQKLINENKYFQSTGGVSQSNRQYNFVPAFLDFESGAIYISSYKNGEPAPIHLYDGLPKHLFLSTNSASGTIAVKPAVVSGFVLSDRFYTREQAMNFVTSEELKH